jgi:MoxR-like ATPase
MLRDITKDIKRQIGTYVLNQDYITELALVALFAGGHVLIEGVPGLAKTLWARSLARALDMECKRIPFTEDTVPSSVLGANAPQLFIADEINLALPKAQSALLEAMDERTAAVDGETQALAEQPFFVIAAQRPMESEGARPLPEALTDRFMMKLFFTYPGVAAEKQLLQMYHQGFDAAKLSETALRPAIGVHDLAGIRKEIAAVNVEEGIFNYIVSVVETTRRVGAVQCGASPRGSVALLLASKTYAAIQGRDSVIPDDVRFLAVPVLRHRIILKPEAETEGIKPDSIIETILEQVKTPKCSTG